MKAQLLLLLLVLSVVQSSPLHGRNRRKGTPKKANEEVRSIISAIVDAILDGDRKRRSEVVDFDDESPHDGSKKTASSKNLKDNEAQSTKIFTKREERESDDNSVPLADVIATSDVNSTDDETAIVKKDVIQHASDGKIAKNDAAFKASNSDEPAFEKSDKSDKRDNAGASGFQNNFSKSKSEESAGIANFLYGMLDGEEPNLDQNGAKKYHQKSIVTKSSSDGKENKVKKSHMKSSSSHPEQKSSAVRPSSGHSTKVANVGKENSESKINNVGKANSALTQNVSTQSETKQNANDNHVEQSAADTYAEFLRVTKTPHPPQKHSSVQHVSDDDSEMNEGSKKSFSSEKSNKFQETKDSMDEDDALSESEQNEDRMEDSKENDHSENEDKFMEDDQGKTSSDASEMDSEDDSRKNSGKQAKINSQSEQTDDFSKPADRAEMDSDEGMTSGKSSIKQSGMKAQSKMETTEDFEEDNSEMDGSSSAEDEEDTTERTGDGSESKDSEDESMGSEKDSSKGSTDTDSVSGKASETGENTGSNSIVGDSKASEAGDEDDTGSTTDTDSVSGKASEAEDETGSTTGTDSVSGHSKASEAGDNIGSTADTDSVSGKASESKDSVSGKASESGDENDTGSTADTDSVSGKASESEDSVSGKASEAGDEDDTGSTTDTDSVSGHSKASEAGDNIGSTADTDSVSGKASESGDSVSGKASESGDENDTGSTADTDSVSGHSKSSEAGDKTGSTTDTDSVSEDGKANEPGDNTESTTDTDSVSEASEAGDEIGSADAASGDSSVVQIGDETNVNGLDTGSADIDSISGDGSSVKMADNSNDLDTPDTMLEDGPGTELKPGPNPSLQDNLKTYKSLKTDSDGSDDDLGQSTGNVNDNMDTGSSDSGMQNTTPSNDNNEDGKVNLKHVNSKQDMDTEDGNLKQANTKQDMVESKTGQISATMNGKENTEMGVEKNAANKEVKLGESGKILETSYRFNDEDTPEVDDFADQANEIWTSNSHDPLLTGDDTSDLARNEETTQDIQPDDAKYGNNLHIGGNDGFEDSYNKQNSENWGDGRMQAPLQSNDYNWLTSGLKSTQHLPNIQDQMQAYQTPDWIGKATPYLDRGESQGYQTTEQPQLEKRTAIPSTEMVQSQYTGDGNKLSRNTPHMIKSKHYTVAADTLTDNDVYGYAGSIGPFLQKRAFVPQTVDPRPEHRKKDDVLESLVTDVNEPWIKHFLTNTLEMAVKGEKGILTSEQDGGDDVKDKPLARRDELVEADSVPKLSQETKIEQDDDMPLDATNNKDDSEDYDDVGGRENTTNFSKEEDKDSSDGDKDSNDSGHDQQNKQKEETASTREKSEEKIELPAIHEFIPNIASKPEGIPLSEVLKYIPKQESSQSPVADIGTIPSQGDDPLKSVIRITTRIPVAQHVPEQTVPSSTERTPVDHHVPDQSESLPSLSAQIPADHHIPEQSEVPPEQVPTSQMIPSTPQLPSSTLPQQPYITTNPSSYMVPAALPTFPEWSSFPEYKPPPHVPTSESQTTKPSPPVAPGTSPDFTSSNQAAPAVVGPIIKVVTTPGTKATVKLTSKGQAHDANKGNTKIQSEIHKALNNSIQNIGISSSNDVLENTIKEAELIHILKDAIPVNQRRPVGTEDDVKQGLDDLKDYAVALTDATGLSQAQRDDVAEKLARDLLDEMRVMDGRKQQLLKELMSFVTAIEVSTFKERLSEIKSRIIQLSTENPQDFVKTRSTAIKLLDELFQQLPLPKEQIKETEKNVGGSKLLKSLLQEGEKRVLRSKLKKALVDLVADKLL